MVSPRTSRHLLREIISVSPPTDSRTVTGFRHNARIRYSKKKDLKDSILEESWIFKKNIYRKKLTWLVLVLLLTCFHALLDKFHTIPSAGISEESVLQVVNAQVGKEIPYQSWWRDDTDYEPHSMTLSLNHLEMSTEIHQASAKPVKASTTPNTSPKSKVTHQETMKKPNASEKKTSEVKKPFHSSKGSSKESPMPSWNANEVIVPQENEYFSLNHSKVMLMLSKFIKQYRIESLVQGRCTPTLETIEMIRVVKRYPNLRFLGMYPDSQVIDQFKKRFGENLKMKFVAKDVMDEIPFGFHLMWNLEGIHDQPYETVLRYLVQLKRKKYKYVALIHVLNADNEKVIREKGTYTPINVRSKPFSLPMPLRMVKEVGTDRHNRPLQLLLYDIAQLPDMEDDEYLREFLSWIG